MKTKIIEGQKCELRDVVYSDFGAVTETEKRVAAMKSNPRFRSSESRNDVFSDRVYSWDESENPYEYYNEDSIQENELDRHFSYMDNNYSYDEELLNLELELQDTNYSAGVNLNQRLMMLKRPLHMQLKMLYKEHMRYVRSNSKLKSKEVDLLVNDFKYELHRIIANAKNQMESGDGPKNMEAILKISSVAGSGGPELKNTVRKLTLLFKRINKSIEKFGYIPRQQQTLLNDSLSVLISHFVLDVYGPEFEKRKLAKLQED